MSTEALLADHAANGEGDTEPQQSATAADIVALVRSINEAEEKVRETRGANDNGLRIAEAGFNANCYLTATPTAAPVPITQDWTVR